MPRTTPQDVKDILGINYDTINNPKLDPYIKGAYLIVNRVIDCASDRGEDISTAEEREIERWVAAYLYTIYDPIYKSKQTANSAATFNDRSYLDGAVAIDPTGCVSAIIKGTNVYMAWLGKTISEQIDIDDRR